MQRRKNWTVPREISERLCNRNLQHSKQLAMISLPVKGPCSLCPPWGYTSDLPWEATVWLRKWNPMHLWGQLTSANCCLSSIRSHCNSSWHCYCVPLETRESVLGKINSMTFATGTSPAVNPLTMQWYNPWVLHQLIPVLLLKDWVFHTSVDFIFLLWELYSCDIWIKGSWATILPAVSKCTGGLQVRTSSVDSKGIMDLDHSCRYQHWVFLTHQTWLFHLLWGTSCNIHSSLIACPSIFVHTKKLILKYSYWLQVQEIESIKMPSFRYSSLELENKSGITDNNGTMTEAYVEKDIATMIWISYSPVLLCFGILGNLISFITLGGPALRHRVSSVYLRVLLLVDTCALIFGLIPIWIIHLSSYDITTQHDSICKIRNFLFYTFSDISIWLICAFTVDRFIAVVFPFRKSTICTRRNAYIAIAVVYILAVAKNVETLATRRIIQQANTTKCKTPDPQHAYYNTYIRPWLVFTLVTAIPCLLILSCNLCIIKTLYDMKKSEAACMRAKNGRKGIGAQVASMTRMCLTVSCTFLLLVSPSIVLLIGRPYWTTSPEQKAQYNLARAIGNLCQYTNNSINFLLYFGSGRAFRKEIFDKLSCVKKETVEIVAVSKDISCALHTNVGGNNLAIHACIGTERTSLISNRLDHVWESLI